MLAAGPSLTCKLLLEEYLRCQSGEPLCYLFYLIVHCCALFRPGKVLLEEHLCCQSGGGSLCRHTAEVQGWVCRL